MKQLLIINIIVVMIISPLLISEAFAEMNVTQRMEDYEITQIANNTWVQKFGLPTHIQDNQGDWIANIFTEDANGVQLESGSLSYYFDKSTCTMSLYNTGKMTPSSIPIIQNDIWVVKYAVNGTENWSEVSQNNLSCVVSTDVQSNMIQINSTKSDANGTIKEIYHYNKYGGLKHTIYFTNNDPSLTNHKFSFSNILEDIPKSFTTFVVTNQSNYTASFDYYSVLGSASQPHQFGGNGTVMDFSASEIIQYNATQYSFNGTQFYHGFNMIEKLSGNETRTIVYDFGDGFSQLSDVKFQSLPDQTIDVLINYQNVTSILPVTGTISLDPQITFDGASGFSVRRAISQGTGSCTGATFRGADTTYIHEVRSFGGGGAQKICWMPMMFFDISSIPDNATPTRITFSLNVTATQTQGFDEVFKDEGRWFSYVTEDLSNVSDTTLSLALIQNLNALTDPDGRLWHFLSSDIFIHCNVFSCPDVIVNNQTAPTATAIVQLEEQLESAKDYLQLFACQQLSGVTPSGCSFSTNQNIHQRALFDQSTTEFEIEWDIFSTPDAPSNQTATYSPSPDKCFVDWEPEFDGGHPLGILGWNILRSTNGGAFTTLVADTGSEIPTDHTDSTIISGESYRYRISGINTEGTGDFAETASCGIPSISDPPVGLIAFEQPQNDITLDWEIAPFDGGLPVLGYKIERSASGGLFQVLEANTNSQATTFIDIAVQANIEYTYRVSQINSLGTSSPSNEASFTIVITGAGAGVGVGVAPVAEPEPEPDVIAQQEFEQALAEAIASIPIQQVTIFETVVQTFFEFAVVDTSHDELTLNSFLDNQRLGIRWSSGQDIIITEISPSPSPISFTFEQVPVIKRGSDAVISTDFIMYNLQVPRQECTIQITINCIEKARYEIPVRVTGIIGNSTLSDTGTITVDLVDELLDPILLILLATFSIPLIAGLVQRARKRPNAVEVVRRGF